MFARERGASRILAAGIADHPGKIADQEEGMMPQILKMAHLVKQDCMAQMQIGRCRIKSGLDSEGPIGGELLLELLFQKKFAATTFDNFQLF